MRASLVALDAAHRLVLDAGDADRVAMALPFANRPTGYRVETAAGAWWANCAWDALAIPRLLALDAARIVDLGDDERPPRTLHVEDGELVERDGLVHFAISAARWWDDIVET